MSEETESLPVRIPLPMYPRIARKRIGDRAARPVYGTNGHVKERQLELLERRDAGGQASCRS